MEMALKHTLCIAVSLAALALMSTLTGCAYYPSPTCPQKNVGKPPIGEYYLTPETRNGDYTKPAKY